MIYYVFCTYFWCPSLENLDRVTHCVKLSKANTRMQTKISLCPASGRCAISTDQSQQIRPLEIITVPFTQGGVRILSLLLYDFFFFSTRTGLPYSIRSKL